VLSQTLVQTEVADKVRGRVSALWGMASLGGAAFGGLALGGLLHFLSIPAATLTTAAIALILPAFAWHIAARGPHHRPVEHQPDPAEELAEPF
jgi:MFS family permease